MIPASPSRPGPGLRRPASPSALAGLLQELELTPPGPPCFVPVSHWAAKAVVRVDVGGQPWAYVRYLFGPAERYPDRWRHLRLATLLNEARVGPRVLGLTPDSTALGGRAAVVEAALRPITREELEARAVEAITLLARLHSSDALQNALARDLTESERQRLKPLARLFSETRERWFEAVVARWLEAGLAPINELAEVVSELINQIEVLGVSDNGTGLIVPAHNDPNHGNFMVNRQGALRLIDFEELALNHPVADLGMFLTWYADRDRHAGLLQHYPLAPAALLQERMRVWVPLRYIGIAAHWAARLTRARDLDAWTFAVDSVEEWLRGAAELIYDGPAPEPMARTLARVSAALLAEWPLQPG